MIERRARSPAPVLAEEGSGGRARASFVVVLLASVASPAIGATAKVVLPEAATTSAGIFDSNGALIRTLWSGQRRGPGSQLIEWDGRTDDGQPVDSKGPYVARVIAHNVRYIWEGVIGNTSAAMQGESVHRAFNPINDMAIDAAGNAFYVVGYNEQQNAIHRFSIADPQRKMPLAHDDYRRVFRFAATDGTLAYFANIAVAPTPGRPPPETPTFVIALRVSDGGEYRFSAGRVEMPDMPGNRWQSAIDYESSSATIGNEFRSAASGLAVQQRGDKLFVAHAGTNEIRVLDKHSGALLERIPIASPGDLDVGPDDSLWALYRERDHPAVAHLRYRDGRWEKDTLPAGNPVAPAAIGVSPVEGTLVVVDAGTEQLKAFDERGNPVWTLGRAGGYVRGGPEVANDKFWFAAGATYLTFQPDGSFWVGDPGNDRNLHFSAQRRYVDQIMYLPASYVAAVDSHDPTRVFSRFLEFRVDYSRPLQKSWKLVRNWAASLDERYQMGFAGFRSVCTLGNGRTYAMLYRPDARADEIVELAASGVRPTGVLLEPDTKLYADGSLRLHRIRLNTLTVYSRELTGFDADGDPQWAAPVALGSAANLDARDPYYHDVPQIAGVNPPLYPVTSAGVVVSFNPARSAGFHLGGIRLGKTGWLWRASPSGTWDVDAQGNILNADGRFEVGRGVQYPANIATAAGRQIVFGYHGEAWNGGQADQWVHFLDDGLFVGQFGRPVYPANNRTDARPESAGNAISPQLVTVGDQLYLWHNDESVHAGVHRWRIEGTDRIRTLEAPIEP